MGHVRRMDLSKFVGSGFTFLQSRLLKIANHDATVHEQDQRHDEQNPTVLSESEKGLLMNLLMQENIILPNSSANPSMPQMHSTKAPDSLRQFVPKKKLIHHDMTEETKLNLAYNHEIFLLGSILSVIDVNHQNYKNQVASVTGGGATTGSSPTVVSATVPTKTILQQCAYTVIPQKTPALLSAREMVCAALHFLCQEYPVQPSRTSNNTVNAATTTIATPVFSLQLPLIHSTSMSSDIERRSYEKTYDWNFVTILPQILLLEHEFYNNAIVQSTRSTDDSNTKQNPLMWLPREFFVPDIKDDQLLRQLYIHGSLPPIASDDTKDNKKNTEKSKSKTPSKATAKTTKSTESTGSTLTKSTQIKRKLPLATPTKNSKSKEEVETDATQRSPSASAIKKIKITLSSKKNSTTPKVTTVSSSSIVPMAPANLDHILAAGTNEMIDENNEEKLHFG